MGYYRIIYNGRIIYILFRYANTRPKILAHDLFKTTYNNVSKWLRCLTDLRNYCAHYSRLYYNLFPAIPPTPKGFSYTLYKRIFDYILVLKFLYFDPVRWSNIFILELEVLIEEYSDCISLSHIGFPENWLQILKEQNPQRTPALNKNTLSKSNSDSGNNSN